MNVSNLTQHKPRQAKPQPTKTAEKLGAQNQIKYHHKPDGTVVKLRRVRRKKDTSETPQLSNPSPSPTGVRAKTTSELGKAAPVQSKTDAVGAKRARGKCFTPGLMGLVKKANPAPKDYNPTTLFETVL